MFRFMLQSAASAGALTLALAAAEAQEALPEIDIGAASGGGASAGPAAKGSPKDPTAYKVWNASSGTKTDTPVMDTPVNIQVVPRQVIDDQQAVVIEEAARNVSNVFPAAYVGLQGGWMIRGFLDYAYYQDGVRVNPFSAVPPRETVDVRQVEIVKGPSSILYGRMQPGGLVEVTTKKPQAEPHYEIGQLIGSFSEYRTTLSMTGPLNEDKTLLYRLDAAYQNAQSFREGLHNNHIYVAPKITFEPTQDTSATVYLQFYRGRDPVDTGIPGIYSPTVPKSWNSVAAVPRSRTFASGDAALLSRSDFRFGYNFSHAFDNDWKLVHRLDISLRDIPNPWVDVYNPDPASCSLASCPLARDILDFGIQEQNYYTSLDLTGHFDAFGLAHTLLVGADGYKTNNDYNWSGNFSNVPSTDLFFPVRGDLRGLAANTEYVAHDVFRESWYGVYLQDQIKLPYDFQLLTGFRYDSARTSTDSTVFFPGYSASSSSVAADAVKPRVALLWRPVPQLSLYGNYVEGFGVNNGMSTSLTALPPEEAKQWEGGAKVELLDGRLSATASYFDILKTNVRSPVLGAGQALGISEISGAVRNTGVEFDVQGQLTPELKIIGSYANIESRIVSDIQGGKVGNHWWGVPRNAGSLWAVYEPDFAPLRGFAFGAGFVARGSVEVDKANSFTLPGYTVVDLMGRYSFEIENRKITFQLNVKNIGDQTYYTSSGGLANFIPGAPRTFRGSVKVEF
jgi:iron complex outermembrane receptor protein